MGPSDGPSRLGSITELTVCLTQVDSDAHKKKDFDPLAVIAEAVKVAETNSHAPVDASEVLCHR